jgi:hypothetical protein
MKKMAFVVRFILPFLILPSLRAAGKLDSELIGYFVCKIKPS